MTCLNYLILSMVQISSTRSLLIDPDLSNDSRGNVVEGGAAVSLRAFVLIVRSLLENLVDTDIIDILIFMLLVFSLIDLSFLVLLRLPLSLALLARLSIDVAL